MSKTPLSSKVKTLTMPGGRVVLLPTNAEDAQINAGIAADPDAWAKYCAGEEKAAGAIVGRIMKASKGKADGKVVSAIMQSRRGS